MDLDWLYDYIFLKDSLLPVAVDESNHLGQADEV